MMAGDPIWTAAFGGARPTLKIAPSTPTAYHRRRPAFLAALTHPHLFRNYSKSLGAERPAKGGLDQRRLSRVSDYINANICADITLAELATVAGLSANHFSACFKTTTGMPPYRFVLRGRLDQAVEYLVTTDRSISDIAHELRFPSHAHMSTRFKRFFGIQPSSLRREWRARANLKELKASTLIQKEIVNFFN